MPRIYTEEQKARRAITAAAYYQRNKHKIDPIAALHRQREWKKANPDKVKAYQRKHQPNSVAKKYGLTMDAVQALFNAQNGKCGVCAKEMASWPSVKTHVDHCHETGKVRGLLCSSCNRYEGWVRRNGDRLRAYLENPPATGVLGVA